MSLISSIKSKALFLGLVPLLVCGNAFATDYTTIADGLFATAANWDANGVPPNPIGSGDTVNIHHRMEGVNPGNWINNGTVTIQPNATTTSTAAAVLADGLNIENYGTFNVIDGFLKLKCLVDQ